MDNSAGVIVLRDACDADARRLWEWSPDLLVLATAFDPKPVSWEDHLRWMTERLADGQSVMFVAETADCTPVGQVRFDRVADGWELDFSIGAAYRGRGYGRQLLHQAVVCARGRWLAQTRLSARVLAANLASRAVCQAAGFVPVEYGTDDERAYVRLERRVGDAEEPS